MKASKACGLVVVLVFLTACSSLRTEMPSHEPYSSLVPAGAYADYPDTTQLRYYKNVLSPKKWDDVEVLNYSQGNFAFPPVAGYRVMEYKNPRRQVQIHLYREILKNETFMDIISRRQASDHCGFTRSLHNKLYDMDIIEALGDCSPWQGDHISKYYFIKIGNIAYTFRLLGYHSDYLLAEPDFDTFVSTTIDNYLIYSPRQQFSPVSSRYVTNVQENEEPELFPEEELISFFAPVTDQRAFSR